MINSHAQDRPDFAFPKTVASNAEEQLKEATKRHDAAAAIEALLQINVANSLIGTDNGPRSIKKLQVTAERFADKPINHLFQALEARFYLRYYMSDQWKFDRRELPPTPLPDRLSEWSGEQFKTRITELCQQSICDAADLKQIPITDYLNVIDCTPLAQIYYPTLYDFVCCNAVSIYDDLGDTDAKGQVVGDAIEESAYGSAPYFAWKCQSNPTLARLQQLYEDHSDNMLAGLVLQTYAERCTHGYNETILEPVYSDNVPDTEEKELQYKRWAVAQIDTFCKRFPDSPILGNLDYYLHDFTKANVSVEYPSICYPGQQIAAKLRITNGKDVTAVLYKIQDETAISKRRFKKYYTERRKLIRTFEVHSDKTPPFRCDTIIDFSVDTPGYYVMYVGADGKVKDYDSRQIFMHCVPAFPITLNGCASGAATVASPSDGSPMAGVKVVVTKDNLAGSPSVTDGQGYAPLNFPKSNSNYNSAKLKLIVGGKEYQFDDVRASTRQNNQPTQSNYATILTDRAIYHPGDEINFLLVAYKSMLDKKKETVSNTLPDKKFSIVLINANYEKVDTVECVTDSFGRASGKFTIPTDGLTGSFFLHGETGGQFYIPDRHVTVSDYRMPDFELNVKSVARDVPAKNCVTVNGSLVTYSGMPVANADVNVILSSASWWRWFSPSRKIYSTQTKSDADGNFEFVFSDSLLTDTDNNPYFIAQIDAVSPTGSTASGSAAFSLGKQFLISLSVPEGNIDGEKPFRPEAKVYNPEGKEVDIPLTWVLKKDDKIIKEGDLTGAINLSDVTPDSYTLCVCAADTTLADCQKARVTIYNRSTDIVPTTNAIWCAERVITAQNGKAKALIGTPNEKAYVYYAVNTFGEISTHGMTEIKRGYNDLIINIPDSSTKAEIVLYTVSECNFEYCKLSITQDPGKPLNIIGESFRDRLIPGAEETWRFRITSSEGKATETAMALDMYNKALDAITPQRFGFTRIGINYFNNIDLDHPLDIECTNSFTAYVNDADLTTLYMPSFNFYGYSNDYGIARPLMAARSVNYRMSMKAESAMDFDDDFECEEEAVADALVTGSADSLNAADTGAHEVEAFEYREADVPMAAWAPTLTTDADGNVTYTFTLPNANTTWRLQALAWTKDMSTGSMMRDFVASKPVMVQPNAPRFMRQGDRAVVKASVFNNSDSVATITTTAEIFNPINGEVIGTYTFQNTVEPMASETVSFGIDAPTDLTAIGYRVRSTNGQFADGEQNVLRILPSMANLIETTPFYLNPGQRDFTTVLPSDPGARISLTFCENPAWSIVSALPGLRQVVTNDANSAAAAIFSAAVARGIIKDNPAIGEAIKVWMSNPSDSTLVSMLEKNEDLKIAVLNSTPWLQSAKSDTERMARLALIFNTKETDAAINSAIKKLEKLQRKDGGWAWCEWSEKSSLWVTLNVLEGMSDLKRMGWLPKDKRLGTMIKKAVNYCDNEVEETDMLYAAVRPYYTDIAINSNGQKVTQRTVSDIIKHWKKYSNVAYKSIAAEILYLNNQKALAHELMRSVSEFGVMTPSQGLTFPSVTSLSSYATVLSSFALIEPQSEAVDGLRQQLIVRKQATDWGTSVITTQVVAAILSTGSCWTVPAQGATITVGDEIVKPQGKIEKATGAISANLSDHGGETLKIETSGVGPSYGAVYSQFSRKMTEVKAAGCDDLTIEKHLTVRRGTGWAMADTLAVGDRVKVQLTIHCKRNLQYVTIIDERAAAFEPVEQIPGWIYSEGVGFYRENRDDFTGLYVDYMRPGTYLLTYELNVNNAGTYSSGVATIQSQYAPEISAHSSGKQLDIK